MFALAAYWLLVSFYVNALRCDDTCNTVAESQRWEYTGQLWIAVPGFLFVVAGLVLGFTTRWRPVSWALLGLGVLCAVAWIAFSRTASL
jgi:hypothetical protein